jgi:hypothetical protein
VDDIARTFDAASDRHEQHLECVSSAPVEVFQVGVKRARAHKNRFAAKSFIGQLLAENGGDVQPGLSSESLAVGADLAY